MVNFPKTVHFHVEFTKNVMEMNRFSWTVLTYGNITVTLMIKIPMHLQNFSPHALNKTSQPVVGKFPTKVKISLAISNSANSDINSFFARLSRYHERFLFNFTV
jgi:hypothetical protein